MPKGQSVFIQKCSAHGSANTPCGEVLNSCQDSDGLGGFEPGRRDLRADSRDPGRISEIFLKISRILQNLKEFYRFLKDFQGLGRIPIAAGIDPPLIFSDVLRFLLNSLILVKFNCIGDLESGNRPI